MSFSYKIVLFLIFLFILNESFYMQEYSGIIVDSEMTFDEAVANLDFPNEVRKNLTIITVLYFGFDEKIHKGQIVIHKKLSAEIKEIFDELFAKRFPIEKVIPIVKYNWDDEASMRDNNSSAFNYRFISGTKKLSNHSYGTAIDINPFQNPYIVGKKTSPRGSKYDKNAKGTILAGSFVVKAFKKRGWKWGGDWTTRRDYQHFEKSLD